MSVSSIGFSSRGGPGRSTTSLSPCSIHCPGADPLGLSSASAPSSTIAWRRLMSGIVYPRLANRCRRVSTIAGSSTSARPSRRATASRVTSSSVGPRPPLVTTRSDRPSAPSMTRATSSMRSPTTALARTAIPISASAVVIASEFVSSRGGSSSSLPTATISAVERGGRDVMRAATPGRSTPAHA